MNVLGHGNLEQSNEIYHSFITKMHKEHFWHIYLYTIHDSCQIDDSTTKHTFECKDLLKIVRLLHTFLPNDTFMMRRSKYI